MTTATAAKLPAPFKRNWWARLALVALAAYLVYACTKLDVSWDRVQVGIDNALRLFGRSLPPNFSRLDLLVNGFVESLQIAVLATALGIVLALPVGLAAARNLMPPWVSWPARATLVTARSLHPVIVAILLVKMIGFGALAGIVALTVASIGFVGKRFTEALEAISLQQVEAVRATGSPFASVLAYGVLPQVFARFIGLSTHQLDSNLRNSTLVGIVGAGGIGGTLFAAFQRSDYDFVCAILIAIVSFLMIGELLAMAVRAIFIDNCTPFDIFRRRGAKGVGRTSVRRDVAAG